MLFTVLDSFSSFPLFSLTSFLLLSLLVILLSLSQSSPLLSFSSSYLLFLFSYLLVLLFFILFSSLSSPSLLLSSTYSLSRPFPPTILSISSSYCIFRLASFRLFRQVSSSASFSRPFSDPSAPSPSFILHFPHPYPTCPPFFFPFFYFPPFLTSSSSPSSFISQHPPPPPFFSVSHPILQFSYILFFFYYYLFFSNHNHAYGKLIKYNLLFLKPSPHPVFCFHIDFLHSFPVSLFPAISFP